MEANELKSHMEGVLKGLNAMVSHVESAAKRSFEGIGKDEAIQFANAIQDLQASEQIEKAKKDIENLKKTFKI